ncbi:CDP-glucose 4,6-dehydratase [Gammaproteobacteria bacterium]|nr:CDP-glucose 4,6-dehydratase [Gammaproteobacteria bacterium]
MVKDNFSGAYKNKRVLITGHTGFKGSWLALWLESIGAEVFGLSLDQQELSHFNLLDLNIDHRIGNVDDFDLFKNILMEVRPEIVFHLAAQPLVRESYNNPIDTWKTNILGSANLLEIAREIDELKSIVMVTSDKCYKNIESNYSYAEDDVLGGLDPYSASKACTEILISSFKHSFFKNTNKLIASARAGNVIGGGDFSLDRIIPDIFRAVSTDKELKIRYPQAIRPWQHVLDCNYGYLLLGKHLLEGNSSFATSFNFGPFKESEISVEILLEKISALWPELAWSLDQNDNPHEATLLSLNHSKAVNELKWRPNLNIDQSISLTADWYSDFINYRNVNSIQQLIDYSTKI